MLSLRQAGRFRHQYRSLLAALASGAAEPVSDSYSGLRQITTSLEASFPLHIEDETYCRQRQQLPLGNRIPYTAPDAWIAPNAIIIGDVDLFDKASVWYGCVLRGDLNAIRIGAFTNIQDRTVIHAARTSPTGLPSSTIVGQSVTVGRACMLRSTNVQDDVIIGDKSILMEGSLVETQSILMPGTVLPPGRYIGSGELWAGNPAKFVRQLTKDEKAAIPTVAAAYFKLTSMHEGQFLPHSMAYLDAEKLKQSLVNPAS